MKTMPPASQENKISRRLDLSAWFNAACQAKNNEKSITLMLKLMIEFGDLSRAFGIPRITGHRFEFPVAGGRIDLLLFHADDSVSIVEAKAEYGAMTIATGIGQLCMYSALLPSALHKDCKPKAVRKILCASLEPEKCADLIFACEMAGVNFAYIPNFAYFKSEIDALRMRVKNEGETKPC